MRHALRPSVGVSRVGTSSAPRLIFRNWRYRNVVRRVRCIGVHRRSRRTRRTVGAHVGLGRRAITTESLQRGGRGPIVDVGQAWRGSCRVLSLPPKKLLSLLGRSLPAELRASGSLTTRQAAQLAGLGSSKKPAQTRSTRLLFGLGDDGKLRDFAVRWGRLARCRRTTGRRRPTKGTAHHIWGIQEAKKGMKYRYRRSRSGMEGLEIRTGRRVGCRKEGQLNGLIR